MFTGCNVTFLSNHHNNALKKETSDLESPKRSLSRILSVHTIRTSTKQGELKNDAFFDPEICLEICRNVLLP